MNWRIKNWFWTQHLVVIGFIIILVVMQLHPWYYNLSKIEESLEEGQTLNFRQTIIKQAGTDQMDNSDLTQLEMNYANGAKMSSLDLIIVLSYLLSISYVLGMFLSSTKTVVIINVPLVLFLILKTIWIIQGTKTYKLATRNVILWWICLVIYLILFILHNKIVITEIDKEELKDGIGIKR